MYFAGTGLHLAPSLETEDHRILRFTILGDSSVQLRQLSVIEMLRHLRGGLLPLRHVQFWETENSRRLGSSHRGGHRRDIPCLVDASDVRTVNALKTPPASSMSAMAMLQQLSFG